jgi:hypothetical protein
MRHSTPREIDARRAFVPVTSRLANVAAAIQLRRFATYLLCRLATSLSHGPKWKALISTYIGNIPMNGDMPCEQITSGVPPRQPVSSAMTAKVGAAASASQSAADVFVTTAERASTSGFGQCVVIAVLTLRAAATVR